MKRQGFQVLVLAPTDGLRFSFQYEPRWWDVIHEPNLMPSGGEAWQQRKEREESYTI